MITNYTLNCKGTLVDLSTPKVMGILNVTPDSFFDGGKYQHEGIMIKQVEKMLKDGATFIDVGGYSSRPGANHVSEEEELSRVLPVVELLVKHFPDILVSIDTFRSKIARSCIEAGASIINDISGGDLDENMFTTVAALQVPYIAMHMQGNPQNMQEKPTYDHVITEVYKALSKKIAALTDLHVHDIILDVGFGFGKTVDQNYELLQHLDYFQNLGCAVLTGVSRKSMLYKPLDLHPEEALNATTAANMLALTKETQILRVHDIKEATEAIQVFNLTCKG